MATTTNPLVRNADIEQGEKVSAKIVFEQGCFPAFKRGLQQDSHKRCFVLNFFSFLSAAATLILTFNLVPAIPVLDTFTLGMIQGVTGFCYIVMLMEASCCSKTATYVWNQKDFVNANVYCNGIVDTQPTLCETAHCFHYETRTRQVAYQETQYYTTYVNGKSESRTRSVTKYRTETYQAVVTKHNDTLPIQMSACHDGSQIPDLSTYSMCKLTCAHSWSVSRGTSGIYDNLCKEFKEKHAHCDTHRSFGENYNLPGFKENLLTYISEQDIPFIIKNGRMMYRLCTMLWLGWIFRVYLSGIVGEQSVRFVKTIDVKAP